MANKSPEMGGADRSAAEGGFGHADLPQCMNGGGKPNIGGFITGDGLLTHVTGVANCAVALCTRGAVESFDGVGVIRYGECVLGTPADEVC